LVIRLIGIKLSAQFLLRVITGHCTCVYNWVLLKTADPQQFIDTLPLEMLIHVPLEIAHIRQIPDFIQPGFIKAGKKPPVDHLMKAQLHMDCYILNTL
jgi:hypothetical protein